MRVNSIKLSRLWVLLWHYISLVLIFMIEKPLFMLYAGGSGHHYGIKDYIKVVWHGLSIDFAVAGYLTVFPLLLIVIGIWISSFPVKRIMQVYDALI